jgi:protein TonB
MLRVADRLTGDAMDGVLVSPPAKLSLVPSVADAGPGAASRYGDRPPVNWPAIVIILLLHALLIAALIQVRQHVVRLREVRLSVVNLTPPPPPPPPASETPPPPAQPKVLAPPPLVQVPAPPPAQVAPAPMPFPAAAAVPATVPVAPPPVIAAPPSIVQGGDIGTQMVAGKAPRYPIESRRKREQGTVVLTLTLGLDGAVESLSITRSSGFARLDNAARDAVRGWRWRPMVRDGQPVRVRGVVEIPFVLRNAFSGAGGHADAAFVSQ